MGSSAKPGKFFFEGHQSTFCIKMPFGIGHPPPTHQMQSTCVQEGSRVPNLQTEFNYLDSFKSYGIFSDFIVPVVPMSSPYCPRHLHSPQKVPMWSPWLWSLWSPPHVVPIVPMVPMSSPHHLRHLHIISTLSRRFPHHPQPPDTHSTHPHPPGGGGPQISKNAIRFELIEIF